MLLAWVDQLVFENPLLGEAKAALRAVKRAVLEGYFNIMIDGDAWNVIEPLSKSDVAPYWSIRVIIDDISCLCNTFVNVSFSFVYRADNVPTRLLGQWASLV